MATAIPAPPPSADRLAGRPGRPVPLTVRGTDRELELSEGSSGAIDAQIRTVVGGVVIARKQVGIDEWVRQLAESWPPGPRRIRPPGRR